MDGYAQALVDRATSAFPISIGTSLALESLFPGTQPAYDPARPIPQRVDVAQYQTFWINLMTLYRNILGAVEKASAHLPMPGDILDALVYEIEVIKHAVQLHTHGKTKVCFYASNYKGLPRHYPHAKVRVDGTDKQKAYSQNMQAVIKAYFKDHPESETLQLFELLLTPAVKTKALILTHYAHDLLSWKSFMELDLIESHTGVLKRRALWYTKLQNGKDLARIPFGAMAMQVFGDGQTFSPMPLPVRKQVLDLAEHYKWTATTTTDRIVLGLSTMSDKFTANILKTML